MKSVCLQQGILGSFPACQLVT